MIHNSSSIQESVECLTTLRLLILNSDVEYLNKSNDVILIEFILINVIHYYTIITTYSYTI